MCIRCENPLRNCPLCDGTGISELRDNGLTVVQCSCVAKARYITHIPHFIHSRTLLTDDSDVLRVMVQEMHPKESRLIQETAGNLDTMHTILYRVHRTFRFQYVESGELLKDHFGTGVLTDEMGVTPYLILRVAWNKHSSLPSILEDFIGMRDRLGLVTWVLQADSKAAKVLPSLDYTVVS